MAAALIMKLGYQSLEYFLDITLWLIWILFVMRIFNYNNTEYKVSGHQKSGVFSLHYQLKGAYIYIYIYAWCMVIFWYKIQVWKTFNVFSLGLLNNWWELLRCLVHKHKRLIGTVSWKFDCLEKNKCGFRVGSYVILNIGSSQHGLGFLLTLGPLLEVMFGDIYLFIWGAHW